MCGPIRKYLTLPKKKNNSVLGWPQARLKSHQPPDIAKSNKSFKESLEWMGARVLNAGQFKCEKICARLAHRGPSLKPYGLHSVKAVEEHIF